MPALKIPHGAWPTIVSMYSDENRTLTFIGKAYGVTAAAIYCGLRKRDVVMKRRKSRALYSRKERSIKRPTMQKRVARNDTPDNVDLLMRGTGQPHRAPLRLPPIGATT